MSTSSILILKQVEKILSQDIWQVSPKTNHKYTSHLILFPAWPSSVYIITTFLEQIPIKSSDISKNY